MSAQVDRLQQTIEILKTPSSQRAEIQISFLQQETNHIGLFKTYKEEDGDDELQRLCCMYMKYEYYSKEQTVFKIDDVGTKFYIIISGKVGVYIRMPKHKRQEAILESGGELNPYEEDPLQMVKELRMGDSFGELALLKNSKRLASIICKEDCHFGVIDKKIFNLALKEKEEEKLNIQMRFLANSPLFSRLPKNTIKILHMNAFYVQYQKNQPVFLEGQNPSACYVIKSGEFTIFKTIDHVIKPHEKKNQYLTGGVGQKTLDLKISVLGKGELFGEIELISGDLRSTSAYCTSLDGGELMIINRTDLEGRVLCEEEYKQQFQKYITMKKNQLSKRIEGIKNQLSKYQTYRFMTSALKSHQVDVCEQIKNKQLNYSIDVLDDIIQSQNDVAGDDTIGLQSSQKNAQSLKYKTKPQQAENQSKSQNIMQNPQNVNQKSNPSLTSVTELPFNDEYGQNKILSQPQLLHQQSSQSNSNSARQVKLDSMDDKGPEATSHITKNTKEQFMSRWFGNGENNEQNANKHQQKKEQILRVELNSYTELKNSIRKKTAVALSKQYRIPYEKFMYAGSMYDISQSESALQSQLQQQQQLQQIQQQLDKNRQGKSLSSLSKFRGQSLTTLNNISTSRNMTTPSNQQTNSAHKIKSLASIDGKLNSLNLKKSHSKGINKEDLPLKYIEEIKEGEESVKNTDVISRFNNIRRVRSHANMRNSENRYYSNDGAQQRDTYKLEFLDKLKQFKLQQFQEINSIDSLRGQNNQNQDTEVIEDTNLIQTIEDHYNNSTNEEGGKKYQQRLKNILKLDIHVENPTADSSPLSSANINSPHLIQHKKQSQASLGGSSTYIKYQTSNENKNSPNPVPLKNAEILFEKQGKKSNKKFHLRLHDNKDSPVKIPFSQSTKSSSSALFSSKKFADDNNNPYFVSTMPGIFSDQTDTISRPLFIEQGTSMNNTLSQPLSPLNPNTKSFFGAKKLSVSSYFKPKSFKKEDGDEIEKEKDISITEKQDYTLKGEQQLTKSQNMQRSLVFKNNSSIGDMNQVISIKSIGSAQDLNLRTQSSERLFRKKNQLGTTSPTSFIFKTLNSVKGFGIKLPQNISPYIKKKQNKDIQPVYKFQQDSPLIVKKVSVDQQQQNHLKNGNNHFFSSTKLHTNN